LLFLVGLFVGASLAVPGAVGAELAALQARIDEAAVEVRTVRGALADARRSLKSKQAALAQLEAAEPELAQRRADALAALKAQFERVVEEPATPLTTELAAYREAAAAQARQQAALAEAREQIAAAQQQVSRLDEQATGADLALAQLRSGLDRARAQRLLREINADGAISVTSTISCEPDETIAGCISRGEETARRRARARYATELFGAVTEAEVVAKHRVTAGVEPQVLESELTDSGFRGQGDYFVALDARLRTEATLQDACALLGLTDAQCRGEQPPAAPAVAGEDALEAEPESDQPDVVDAPPAPADTETPAPDAAATEGATEAPRYRLTVRSNVYYDEVYIDGVPYGSTKLDVLLPPGEYDVEVRKPGHSPHRERIELTGSRVLRAQLAELEN
jgi:flagellar biosynthesis chaperone FliJ